MDSEEGFQGGFYTSAGGRASHACVSCSRSDRWGHQKALPEVLVLQRPWRGPQINKARQVLNCIYRGCATSNLDFLTFALHVVQVISPCKVFLLLSSQSGNEVLRHSGVQRLMTPVIRAVRPWTVRNIASFLVSIRIRFPYRETRYWEICGGSGAPFAGYLRARGGCIDCAIGKILS